MGKLGCVGFCLVVLLACSDYETSLVTEIPPEADSIDTDLDSVLVNDEDFEVRQIDWNKDSIPVIRFADSTTIGIPGKYKMVIEKMLETFHYEFWLYKREGSGWTEIQHVEDRTDEAYMFDPLVKDYNGEGFKDLSFHHMTAARGGNELRIIFLFDPKKKQLVWLKNSEKYPNLSYQKELKMLNGWALHAGSTTLFLEIQGDSVVKKATCEWYDSTIYIGIQQNGKWLEKEIDTIYQDPYMLRFYNFDPIVIKRNKHFK
mgnify:CR=1 FL=1